MKRLFTLAIVAMIASLTFAQAPVQKKAAAKAQIEKVASNAQMQKAMEAKVAMTAKAQAAQETSASALRKAAHVNVAAVKQIAAPRVLGAQNVRPIQNVPARMQKSKLPTSKAADFNLAAESMFKTRTAAQKVNAPAKAAVADGMSAYIQENVTGQFVSNGAYWGTRSVLSDNGILYRIGAGSEGKYILFSGIKDDTKALRDTDGFNDQSGEWTLVPAQDGGYYMVNRNQEYYTKVAGSDIPGFTTNQEEASIWNFITPDERALELASASASNPVDATFLIKGADFLNADIANAAWNKSKVGGDMGSGCTLINSTNCEQWNAGAVDINQTLTNIPNGIYRLKAYGFVRQNGATVSSVTSYEEGTETPAYLYANDQETKLKSVFDDAYTEPKNGWSTVTSESGNTYVIPNGQNTAAAAFEDGKYLTDEIEVEVTDGTLKVGVKCDGVEWLVFDNFRLTYLGAAVQATVVEAVDAAATYYASDGDWYCMLKDADNNLFYFDIVTNNPAPLEIGHEYTLADMDASYSLMKVGSKKYAYSSATFTPKQGQYGTDYEATCVLASNGEAYHIYYTAPKPETIEVEATTAGVTWYGEPDNDWFINLYNANFEFRFDIGNQSANGLLLDHEYTLADMIADYSWGKNKATNESITYQSVSFKATTGANGTDYQAVVVDKKGNTYNVKYTTVAPPPTTDTVELEFAVAETDLVDAASSMGLIQFVGAKEETGLEAYVGLHTTQVAGSYTMADVEAMYTAIYLDYNDQEGVSCADLTGTVTDLGNGAYKAYFEYLGTNGTLYKLTYNYGEAGDPTGEVVVNKDAHGIITSVTGGEAKTYTRSADGTVYFVQSSQLSMGAQSGSVTIIEDAANGKVYIKDPIARFANNSWAEGTKNGNQVVVNAGQPLYYSSNYDATVSLRWGVISASGSLTNADGHADNFTYTVDGDTWTLDGTAAFGNVNGDAFFMGGFWDDDDSFQAGEAETVLTYDPNHEEPSTDLVELPDGAQVQEWYMTGTSVTSSAQTPFQNQKVNVAFVGNDVYAQVFSAFPTSWIKGTKEGNTVTFKKFQYIGNYGGSYDMYFIGTDGQEMTDATATLSADAKTLTFNESLLANAATDRIYYLTWLQDVVLTAEPAEEPVITELMAELPYANSFDTTAEQEEAAIYDANGDGKTFTFADDTKSGSKTARYAYSTANNADDYVVFPGFTMEAGKSYKVSVDARPYGASYPERLEIVAGTVAKASELNISILEPTDLTAGDYETLTAEFVPETSGVYYIALHAISDADMFYLYTDNFSVKENNPNTPAAIADLVVTPDENADLSAAIEFTAPAKTLGGNNITEEVKCVVKRDGEVIKDNIVVAAGTPVQLMDNTVPAPGTYVYSVTATVGELTSDAAKATVYVGEDIPDEVENLVATDLNGKVGLTWDAPADGVNGGIIIPENLRYNVYPVEMIEFFGMQFPAIDFDNPYFTELTATQAEVDYDTNEGEQQYTYFGVTAANAAGESQGMMGAVLTGAPYELPVVEEFPNGTLSYWWGVDYDDAVYEADGGLGITTDGELEFNAPVAGWIELYSGKVAIDGADKPQLSFQYKGDGKLTATVYGPTKSMNGVEFTPAADYQTATVDLSELASEPWVRLTLKAEYADAGVTNVDNIIFMNAVENDLEIAVSAPKTVVAGQSAVVTATVVNKGTADASDYAVKFYVNEEEIEAPAFEIPTLKFFESAEFEYTLETSIFSEAGDLTVKAEVIYAADVDESNNADEVVLAVVTPTATPVEGVVAEEIVEGSVKIDWTVASVTNEEITEDFESYEVGIVTDGETMGPWAAKDGDQGMAYGWSSSSINWPYTGEMYAFGIMNFPEVFGSATDIEAASGDQALMFMSVTDAEGNGLEADDWFISPELPGIAQTISFKACPMTANYGAETVEVMASTDGQNWSKVATYDIDEENTWTECTGNLPAGTKYFALHYVSNDIFALFIDDVTYTAGGAEATGFNIYVDETLVASVAADARTYTATEVPAGNHKFSVTAVYGQKESAPVSATLATAINSVAGTQTATEAYTISGIRMDAKNLKKGVYVVNGKKVVK